MTKLGAAPISAPGWTAQPHEGVKIVDCDVHHNFERPEQLLPYLSSFWQNHLIDQGLHLPSAGYSNIPFRTNRADLKDPELKESATSTFRWSLCSASISTHGTSTTRY